MADRYRSSVSGEFTTKKVADKKPREHEKEKVKTPPKGKKKP